MILPFHDEFASSDGSVWLNTAHQGRLPIRAADAVREAVEWKLHPEALVAAAPFTDLPDRLRRLLARLLGAEPSDVVLANSASYGLHLIANGLELAPGDEVVVAANDFPSDVLPWLRLRDRGVAVRMLEPKDEVLTADEVVAAFNARTRVVCLTWVHSFSGRVADLEAIGAACRDRGIWFVVNGSQGVGVLPIDVTAAPIDALIGVGFKWLCGPYGTGFAWLRPQLNDALHPTKLYWLSALTAEDLAAPSLDLEAIQPTAVGRHDIFGTANFFNFMPFAASLELVLEVGVDSIGTYVDDLVLRLLDGIAGTDLRLISSPVQRSSLVVVEPTRQHPGELFDRLSAAGIQVAHRRGRIRFSPHLYNTATEIDQTLELLRS
jgi:cysteine desulfurase / selenocysteine lyase